jgi:tryptophanyl-tRNA synthetase
MSDLNKMTQYKDKSQGNENVSVGLFDYPVLMASDILLYNTSLVPTGEDQKQHVELTRVLAKRFNSQVEDIFKVPETLIDKSGARIMGLDDVSKKMSKSAKSEFNYIALLDSPDKARKKVMKAITDTGSEIKYNKETKPAISNLLTIYSLLSNLSIKELELKYQAKGYGEFKKDLAEVVIRFLNDFQKRYNNISDEEVLNFLSEGNREAKSIAKDTLNKVKKAIGIYN